MKESRKDKLESYARKEFGVELDKRLTIKKLEAQIKELESNKEVSEPVVVTVDKWWASDGIGNRMVKSDDKSTIELLVSHRWTKEQ